MVVPVSANSCDSTRTSPWRLASAWTCSGVGAPSTSITTSSGMMPVCARPSVGAASDMATTAAASDRCFGNMACSLMARSPSRTACLANTSPLRQLHAHAGITFTRAQGYQSVCTIMGSQTPLKLGFRFSLKAAMPSL